MKQFSNFQNFLNSVAALAITAWAWTCVVASPAEAVQQMPGKVRFSASIESPAAIDSCAGSLWVYSARNHDLVRLNPMSGAVLGTTPLSSIGLDGHIVALGCTGNSLLIAMQKRHGLSDRTFALFNVPLTDSKPAHAKPLTLPGTGLVRDVFCRGSSYYCFLIRDQVFKTSDLRKWTPAEIPYSKDIPFTDRNTQENPFADWQDKFIVANGQYFRGGFYDESMFLLDPLRVSVVTLSMAPGGAAGTLKSGKWGRWGVWEGRMMSPKGIALLGKAGAGKSYFAISDVALKLVFVFAQDGKYMGSLGADGAAARFNYPLDIVAIHDILYVADFGASKVIALEINPAAPVTAVSAPAKTKGDEKIEELLRKNFFRDAGILKARARTRCLTCHDGLQINSLDKFMEQGKHHPINVTMRAVKIDLPLESGTTVTCSTCHDAHHGIAEGPTAAKGPKHQPFMLRKPVKELCSTCHSGRTDPERNHLVMNPEDACADCHSMHVSQDYLLKEKIPDLCLGCHGSDKAPTSHPFSADMGVTCVSCHSLHDSAPKMSFAAHAKFAATGKGDTKSTCLSCHEDKKALIGKSYHLGTEGQNSHPWPKDEGMCLDCHDPHAKPRQVKQICAQCHTDQAKSVHPASVAALADTPAAKGMVLEKGKGVFCMTCHDPHGGTPPNENGRNFFRPADKIMAFCAGCHGDKAGEFYRTFHNRGGKKK